MLDQPELLTEVALQEAAYRAAYRQVCREMDLHDLGRAFDEHLTDAERRVDQALGRL